MTPPKRKKKVVDGEVGFQQPMAAAATTIRHQGATKVRVGWEANASTFTAKVRRALKVWCEGPPYPQTYKVGAAAPR